jgi:hypothetical protein
MIQTRRARQGFFDSYPNRWEALFAQAVAVARTGPGTLQELRRMPIDEAVEWAAVQMVAPTG